MLFRSLLVLCVGFAAKLFLIGDPVAGGQVYCTVSENGQDLELQVDTVESAMALRGWKHEQDGGTLYLSARKVLVSPFFDEGHYETSIKIGAIDKIVLGGEIVWPCKD